MRFLRTVLPPMVAVFDAPVVPSISPSVPLTPTTERSSVERFSRRSLPLSFDAFTLPVSEVLALTEATNSSTVNVAAVTAGTPLVDARLPTAKPADVNVALSPASVMLLPDVPVNTNWPLDPSTDTPPSPPVAASSAALILVAAVAAVTPATRVLTLTAVPPFRPVAWMVIAAGEPPRVAPPPVKPPVPVRVALVAATATRLRATLTEPDTAPPENVRFFSDAEPIVVASTV